MADIEPQKPNVREAVPFFMVTDMEASLRFYVGGLGFQMTKSWRPEGPDKVTWCSLQIGSAGLMLQEFSRRDGKRGKPEGALGHGVSICFVCEDALAIYRTARANGLSPRRPFVGNAMWVVGFADPDGYRIDFESVTNAPEETEYDPAVHG